MLVALGHAGQRVAADELMALAGHRRWLPAAGYEGAASIGGSFYSDDIEDYCFTPWDLGFGHLVKFDVSQGNLVNIVSRESRAHVAHGGV